MPRNAAGVYSLPNPPRVPLTTIYALDENQTRDDLASAVTSSLDRSGRGPMLAPVKVPDGLVGAPTYSWTNEPSSGWYRAGLNDFRFAVAGVDVFKVNASGAQIPGTGTSVFESIIQQTRADGVFQRWIDSGGIAGEKTAGLQIDASSLLFGMMADDFSAFTEYLRFDKTTDRITSVAANGFAVTDELMIDEFFVVDPVADKVIVNNGGMAISKGLPNDDTLYNSALLSLNTNTLLSSGVTVHYTVGGAGSLAASTFMWGGAVVGSIAIGAGGTTYNTVSDRRMKEDIRPLIGVGDMIDRLWPVKFKWTGLKTDHIGFIAQDVVEVVPDAVTEPGNPSALWQMDAGKLMPLVIAELKSLRHRISALER